MNCNQVFSLERERNGSIVRKAGAGHIYQIQFEVYNVQTPL